LSSASVQSRVKTLVSFELSQKLRRAKGWQLIDTRNQWFQRQARKSLEQAVTHIKFQDRPILFTYSYAALELLNYAKQQGWYTVLGQIDAAFIEEQIEAEERDRHPSYRSAWAPAPATYWQNWQEECALADQILVNSHWSSQAIQRMGVPASKIQLVPLAFEPPAEASQFNRSYPQAFSADRPLRILFLGQVILRKGIVALLEAAKLVRGQPIEFWIVGSLGIQIPDWVCNLPNVKVFGSVPRSSVVEFYQQADVFIFPTLSDGFGLTQLEAQAWKLPIIASRNCGEVVEDQVNGLILETVSPERIADILTHCLKSPQELTRFSQQSRHLSEFSLARLSAQLSQFSLSSRERVKPPIREVSTCGDAK
jgi:glycosyltransferase involved in cell wall biosynthesis